MNSGSFINFLSSTSGEDRASSGLGLHARNHWSEGAREHGEERICSVLSSNSCCLNPVALLQHPCTMLATSHVLGGSTLVWLFLPQIMENLSVTFFGASPAGRWKSEFFQGWFLCGLVTPQWSQPQSLSAGKGLDYVNCMQGIHSVLRLKYLIQYLRSLAVLSRQHTRESLPEVIKGTHKMDI